MTGSFTIYSAYKDGRWKYKVKVRGFAMVLWIIRSLQKRGIRFAVVEDFPKRGLL